MSAAEDERAERRAAELAALADGSLAPSGGRRSRQVAASPELAALLAEQERAVALARSAAAQVEAPAALRARVEAQQRPQRDVHAAARRRSARPRRGRGRPRGRCRASSARAPRPSASAALAATALAPGRHGRATLTKTTRAGASSFDATGLPRLDDGRFYEAWLKNADGVLVPVGTFNEGGNVILWAGVSPKDFPTLTVTRERADGDQDSSGEKVLVGTVDTGG